MLAILLGSIPGKAQENLKAKQDKQALRTAPVPNTPPVGALRNSPPTDVFLCRVGLAVQSLNVAFQRATFHP